MCYSNTNENTYNIIFQHKVLDNSIPNTTCLKKIQFSNIFQDGGQKMACCTTVRVSISSMLSIHILSNICRRKSRLTLILLNYIVMY